MCTLCELEEGCGPDLEGKISLEDERSIDRLFSLNNNKRVLGSSCFGREPLQTAKRLARLLRKWREKKDQRYRYPLLTPRRRHGEKTARALL